MTSQQSDLINEGDIDELPNEVYTNILDQLLYPDSLKNLNYKPQTQKTIEKNMYKGNKIITQDGMLDKRDQK